MSIHIFGYDFQNFDGETYRQDGCKRLLDICTRLITNGHTQAATRLFEEIGRLQTVRVKGDYDDLSEQLWKVGNACKAVRKIIIDNPNAYSDLMWKVDIGMHFLLLWGYCEYVTAYFSEGPNYAADVEPPLVHSHRKGKEVK